jgi:hypothetical protein
VLTADPSTDWHVCLFVRGCIAEADHGEDLLPLRGGKDAEVPASRAEVCLVIRNQG